MCEFSLLNHFTSTFWAVLWVLWARGYCSIYWLLSTTNSERKCNLSGTGVEKFITNYFNIINYPGDAGVSVLSKNWPL